MLIVTNRPIGPSGVGTVMTWDGSSMGPDGPTVSVVTSTSDRRTILGVVWRRVGDRIWLAWANWFAPSPALAQGFPNEPGLLVVRGGQILVRGTAAWNDIVVGTWTGRVDGRAYLFSEACLGPPPLLDVSWFGAGVLNPDTGDLAGMSDSLPAFEAAIAASGAADAPTLSGFARTRLQNQAGIVRVPPGSYGLSAPLQVWRPCRIIGAGPEATMLVCEGSTGLVITSSALANEDRFITSAAPVPLDKSGGQGAVVSGLTIKGPGRTVSSGAGVFMNARATLDSLHTTEFRTGIHVWASGEPQRVPGLIGGGTPVLVTMRVRLKPGLADQAAVVATIKARPSSGPDVIATHVLWVNTRPTVADPLSRSGGPISSSNELEVSIETRILDPGPARTAMDDSAISGVKTIEYFLRMTPVPGSTFGSCSLTFNTPSHTLLQYGSLLVNGIAPTDNVDGVTFDLDHNLYAAANSNDWRVLYCTASNCQIGMHVHGQESSAGLALHYFGDGEMRWALYDSSFLNATYVATHLEGGSLTPEEAPAGSLLSDGAVNRSVFLGTYIESALGAPVLRGPSLLIGGAVTPNFESEPGSLPILARARPLPWLNVEPHGTNTAGLQIALGARPQALDGGGRPGLLFTPMKIATGGGTDTDASFYYMNTLDDSNPAREPQSWYAFKVHDSAANEAFRITGGFHPDGAGQMMLRSGTSLGTDVNVAVRQFVTPETPARLTGVAFRVGDIIWAADPHIRVGDSTVNGWRCLDPGAIDAATFRSFAGTAHIGDILSDGSRIFRCEHIQRRDPQTGVISPRKECPNIVIGMLTGGGLQTAAVRDFDNTPNVTYLLRWNDIGEAWSLNNWQAHFRVF